MIKIYRIDVGMFHLTYIFKIIDNSIMVKRIIIYEGVMGQVISPTYIVDFNFYISPKPMKSKTILGNI